LYVCEYDIISNENKLFFDKIEEIEWQREDWPQYVDQLKFYE